MAKKGKLYGIGVGPGDTELVTLKAARILKSVPVVFTPKSSKEKESIALSIVKPILEERDDYKRLMHVTPIFPMIEVSQPNLAKPIIVFAADPPGVSVSLLMKLSSSAETISSTE